MSQAFETPDIFQDLLRSMSELIASVREESPNCSTCGELIDFDEAGPNLSTSNSEADASVSLQDLYNCPEFLEEQKLILQELEAARFRVKAGSGNPPHRRGHKTVSNPSRRGSIGIKLNCPICLESLSSVSCCYVKMVTECGHVFCQCCIEGICKAADDADEEALCPVCREEVGDLRKVYF